jgi:hypothetical protein
VGPGPRKTLRFHHEPEFSSWKTRCWPRNAGSPQQCGFVERVNSALWDSLTNRDVLDLAGGENTVRLPPGAYGQLRSLSPRPDRHSGLETR